MTNYMRKLCVTQAKQNTPRNRRFLPEFGKIRNKIANRVNETPDPYNPKNTAKWSRMFIKAGLLFDLIDVADEMENELLEQYDRTIKELLHVLLN